MADMPGVNGGSFLNTIPAAEDGQDVDGASVQQTAQGGANQDKYLYDAITRVAYTDVVHGLNGRNGRRPRVPLTAADHTIDTSEGDGFQLAAFVVGGPFTITLRTSTAPVPTNGERIYLYTDYNYAPSGTAWIIQREDGTDICWFVAKPTTELMAVSAEFEFVGGVWRLGLNSGYDTSALMGVLPKAGA